jgi:D-mannonate dehydratase
MYKVMEALVEINFDGLVIPDHVPELGPAAGPQGAGSNPTGQFQPNPGLAYSIGYLNATLKAALSNRRKA